MRSSIQRENEQTYQNPMAETASSLSSCPCCIFLPDDLFLPDNVKSNSSSTSTGTSFLRPQEALQEIASSGANAVLVDTHGHPHLQRDLHESYRIETIPAIEIISLSCAVEPDDWQACLDYAATSDSILCGLGVHPWYMADLPEGYLATLEDMLQRHTNVIVGEIGLCKMARFVRTYPGGKAAALELQRTVFTQQLKLAAKYERPVSVHCVDQHAVLMKVLAELTPQEIPPTIGMHSFTGSAHHVRQLLKFEQQSTAKTKIYFGFSHIINFEMNSSEKSRRQGIDAIHAVPYDRLLAESDVHSSRDVAVGTAGAIAYLAYALDKPIADVALQTAKNGIEFLRTRKDLLRSV